RRGSESGRRWGGCRRPPKPPPPAPAPRRRSPLAEARPRRPRPGSAPTRAPSPPRPNEGPRSIPPPPPRTRAREGGPRRRRSGCEKGAARPLHRSMCHPAPAGAPATVSDPERFTSEPDRTRPLGMAARPRHKRSTQAYHELLARILDEGVEQQDRTGTGTLSVFGHQMRFDLSKGFPLLTTQ